MIYLFINAKTWTQSISFQSSSLFQGSDLGRFLFAKQEVITLCGVIKAESIPTECILVSILYKLINQHTSVVKANHNTG